MRVSGPAMQVTARVAARASSGASAISVSTVMLAVLITGVPLQNGDVDDSTDVG